MGDFKVCPNCEYIWNTRDDFMNDPEVSIIGYQVNFNVLKAGLFLFNHSCKGTFAIEVKPFADLYDGPIFSERATGTDDCPGYCLRKENLDLCPAKCECAFVRHIIQLFKTQKA